MYIRIQRRTRVDHPPLSASLLAASTIDYCPHGPDALVFRSFLSFLSFAPSLSVSSSLLLLLFLISFLLSSFFPFILFSLSLSFFLTDTLLCVSVSLLCDWCLVSGCFDYNRPFPHTLTLTPGVALSN